VKPLLLPLYVGLAPQRRRSERALSSSWGSLRADQPSGLRSQLSDSARELATIKADYIKLASRNLALEDEKASLAQQIKTFEAELAGRRIEGKTTMTPEHELVLAKGEVSMALHKLSASEARLEQKERAHDRLKVSNILFSLASRFSFS